MSDAPTPVITVRAHAKINLDLQVLGVRPDGFHELRTVFQSLALHDTLICIPRRGPFRLECAAPGVPVDRTNLVWRAADQLWRMLGRRGPARDVSIRLVKRIPAEAGLGGGSADAAAALRALARVWGVRVRVADLAAIAAGLGADVPFFLWGGTALGLGRGDDISPMPDMPRDTAVLLLPGFGVSSREAYRWYDKLAVSKRRRRRARPGAWSSRSKRLANDLELGVARHHAEIGRMKTALTRAGAWGAAMSGSGSTVYGLFDEREAARAAARTLEGRRWRVVVTELLDRRAYARRARPGRATTLPARARLG